jgi:hypothetical protein
MHDAAVYTTAKMMKGSNNVLKKVVKGIIVDKKKQ